MPFPHLLLKAGDGARLWEMSPAPGGKHLRTGQGVQAEKPAQTDLGEPTLALLVTFPPLTALAQASLGHTLNTVILSVQFCI